MDKRVETIASTLPHPLNKLVLPESPIDRRKMLAQGALPMPVENLLKVLIILTYDPYQEVREAASLTISDLPTETVLTLLKNIEDPVFLSVAAEYFINNPDERYLESIVLNRNITGETLAFIAKHASTRISELIALNQVKIIEYPEIIKNLYFNPKVKTITLNRAIETAYRNNVDLSFLPGHEQIIKSILGEQEGTEEARKEEKEEEGKTPLSDETHQEAAEEEYSSEAELLEEEFLKILEYAAKNDDLTIAVEESIYSDDYGFKAKKGIFQMIKEMSVAQKVRLALMGNQTARHILIRDPKKIVAMAVLESPKVTEKEIEEFAKNKTLGEDIIRRIAYTREWVKNYNIQKALVVNPKCPPQKALEFIKNLRMKDLKELARDKEVPSMIQRQAKALLVKREKYRRV